MYTSQVSLSPRVSRTRAGVPRKVESTLWSVDVYVGYRVPHLRTGSTRSIGSLSSLIHYAERIHPKDSFYRSFTPDSGLFDPQRWLLTGDGTGEGTLTLRTPECSTITRDFSSSGPTQEAYCRLRWSRGS